MITLCRSHPQPKPWDPADFVLTEKVDALNRRANLNLL